VTGLVARPRGTDGFRGQPGAVLNRGDDIGLPLGAADKAVAILVVKFFPIHTLDRPFLI